ncbi:hypothetical protein AB0953_28090 [Streptomyces sp. NPDC046866]|uniref:hypothetical protein n=1 Tax=Streptomyces sp. NPDC046866 TaxID=3154921 RepID=UPI003456A0DD
MTVSESNEARGRGDEPKRPVGHEVDFPPVENGVDYLQSVVEHLTAEQQPGPRHLKYAVLHLQAAAEVLLKARLQREHWSLVFADPGLATRRTFEAGAFNSCGIKETIARLKDIARVNIDDKAVAHLADLTKDRNALQHYGLTHNARAVESRAAKVLDFLVTFVHTELLPALTPIEAQKVAGTLETVGEDVRMIQSFIKTRLNRLRGDLKDIQGATVECPSCDRWALVVGGQEGEPTCHFCHVDWGPRGANGAADLYVWQRSEDFGSVARCPSCGVTALIVGEVSVAAAPMTTCSLCFACGTRHDDLPACNACEKTYVPDKHTIGLCGWCEHAATQ